MTMNEQQRIEFLATLGMTPEVAVEAPAQTGTIDRHTMPVTSIVFDPADIAEFGDLEGMNRRLAADKLFAMYRAPGRDKDRNSLLWSKVGLFLSQQAKLRKSGGVIKEKIAVTKEQREIAEFIASAGITMADLAAMVKPQEEACAPSAGTADSESGL